MRSRLQNAPAWKMLRAAREVWTMGGWTRRGAVVLGASLIAVAVTGGKAVRGVSYAVTPPVPLRITTADPATLELGRPFMREAAPRQRPGEIAAQVTRERRMMTAALLMLLAEGASRSGSP